MLNIIKPSTEIMTPIDRESILKHIELCGRVCYKSENKITEDSGSNFVKMISKRQHESVLEHHQVTVRFIFDRGVSHETVRHRAGTAYSQESTRYCNYDRGEFTFIKPVFFADISQKYQIWYNTMLTCAKAYEDLIELGSTPQEARSVLPNSLKTELVMTANLRAWKHFFKLRCAKAAHPQMREVAIPLYEKFNEALPEVFGDLL